MYESPSDYELLYLIHQNDEESLVILLQRYHKTIWAIIHSLVPHPIPYEIDLDDLYQEGTLGLMDAITNFKEEKQVSFGSFARVCIEREIRSMLRKYRSNSYRILSRAVSLDMSISEDDHLTLMDTVAIEAHESDPVYITHINWAKSQIPQIRHGLPDYQWKIYQMHALGYSYKEIAVKLDVSEKDVDNVIQKIRKKIRSLFDTL